MGISKGQPDVLETRSSHPHMKQANILVNNRGNARVGVFGLMTVVDLSPIF